MSASHVRGVDLSCYWAGGTILAAGDAPELYTRARARAELHKLFPPHPPDYPIAYPPPIYQLFELPQPAVSYGVAVRAILAIMATLHLVGAVLVTAATPKLGRWGSAALAAAMLCPGGLSVVISGQLAGLWLTCLGGGLWLRLRGRPFLGGLALAGLWMKPTLAGPVFVTLALFGEGAALAGMVAGGAAILLVSLAAGGVAPWIAYVELMRGPGAVLASMFKHLDRQLTLRALFAGLAPKAYAAPIGWFGAGLGLLGTVVISRLGRRSADPSAAALAFGATLSTAYLASPHFYEYDAALHLPGLLASAAWLASGRAAWPRVGAALSALGFVSGAAVLANPALGINVATIFAVAWVSWMAAELWRLRDAPR